MKTELVTNLKRKATEIIDALKRHREPVLITQHGTPSAYLLDVDSYHELQARVEILEGIARGEKAILEERVVSHEDAKKHMQRWLK